MSDTVDTKPSPHPFGHLSDCAVNNGPALPVGPCDCAGRLSRRETLEALLERVRGATGPSRELDGLIHAACGMHMNPHPNAAGWGRWPDETAAGDCFYRVAPVTAGIDAAAGLVERRLPGSTLHMSVSFDGCGVSAYIEIGDERTECFSGATLALAAMAALLTALIAQETKDD